MVVMDKENKEIEQHLNMALFEPDKAFDYIFRKEYYDAAVTLKMAKIELAEIKRVLGYD